MQETLCDMFLIQDLESILIATNVKSHVGLPR